MNSNVKHTNEDLLAMGKANFVRLVSAFEHSLAGSAQEKIHQRSDLEAMVEQIEQMSLEDEAQELLQCWREGKDVMQQLSGEAAAAGEVAELEMACAKAESLLFQVLGEEIVCGTTTASGTGSYAAENAEEGCATEGAGLATSSQNQGDASSASRASAGRGAEDVARAHELEQADFVE